MISGKPPDPGRRKRAVQKWDYEAPENGKFLVGFLAGKPTGTFLHYMPRSRPCRLLMSEGKVPCPFCADGNEPSWGGYLPYYSPEYTRKFVIIKEDHYEATMELELHTQVKLSRAKDSKAPVVVRPFNFRLTPIPADPEREKSVDMLPFLLHVLWKDQALLKFHAGISSMAVPGPAGTVPLISDTLVNAITRQAERTQAQADAAKKNDEFVRSLQARQTSGELVAGDQAEQLGEKPTRNGKHKPR